MATASNKRTKTIWLVVLGVLLIGLSVLIWALSTGRIGTFADTYTVDISGATSFKNYLYRSCSKLKYYTGGTSPCSNDGNGVDIGDTGAWVPNGSSWKYESVNGAFNNNTGQTTTMPSTPVYLSKSIGSSGYKINNFGVTLYRTSDAGGAQADIYAMSAVNKSKPTDDNLDSSDWIKIATTELDGVRDISIKPVDGALNNISEGPIYFRMDLVNVVVTEIAFNFEPTAQPTPTSSIGEPPVPTAPSAPTGLSAHVDDCDTITLSWDRVPGATSYRIFKTYSSDPDTIIRIHPAISQTDAQTYSKTLDGWSPEGGVRNLGVIAINSWGETLSDQLTVTTPACSEDTPNPPANVTAQVGGTECNNNVTVSWKEVTNAEIDSYAVYGVRTDKEGIGGVVQPDIKIENIDKNNTEYLITSSMLVPDKTYEFWVVATSTVGNDSAESERATTTIPDCPIIPEDLPVPTNLSITSANKYAVNLAWEISDETNVTGYNVYNGDDTIVGTTPNKDFMVEGNFCDGDNTTFYVRSYNSGGVSDPSNSVTASINCAQGISRPENIELTQPESNILILSWDPVGGAYAYDIYDCSGQLVGTSDESLFTIENPDCSSTYCFYVIAKAEDGTSSEPSDQALIDTFACGTPSDTTETPTALVSTGSSLWFNILLAVLLTLGLGYFIFRSDIWHKE